VTVSPCQGLLCLSSYFQLCQPTSREVLDDVMRSSIQMITGELPLSSEIWKQILNMPSPCVVELQVGSIKIAVVHPTNAIQMAVANPKTSSWIKHYPKKSINSC
jgi:hypothetical protein